MNCPKTVAYMVKIVKFLVRIISEHSEKSVSLMFETETLEPCLVWKLKWGWPWPLAPPPLPNGYAPVLNEIIGVIGHENTIYCKANKS